MSNYTQLQTDIADWFARQDLPATTFITLAESELNRVLRLQAMESMSTATPTLKTSTGLYYLTFPADYLQLRHIESGGVCLDFVSVDQLTTDNKYFFTIANQLFLFPGLDPVDIYYHASVPALSDTNQTNLFTQLCYDALLYLCLDHASSYMGQPGDHRQRAMAMLTELQSMDNRARMGDSPLVQRG